MDTDLVADFKEQRITGRGAGLARMSSALVVVQAALSLVLLVGAGLCLRTLHNARAINFGFDTERVLTARLDLGRQSYAEPQGQLFYQQLLERAQALPGVQQASLALSVPLTGADYGTGIKLEGRAEQISLLYNIVTSHYFGTMGIPQDGENSADWEHRGARQMAHKPPIVSVGVRRQDMRREIDGSLHS